METAKQAVETANQIPMWQIILMSAAVGTVVGSLISSIFTMVAQCLEQRQKRRELLFTRAVDLTMEWYRFTCEVAKSSQQNIGAVRSPAITAEEFFQLFEHLWKYGELPKEFHEKEAKLFGGPQK